MYMGALKTLYKAETHYQSALAVVFIIYLMSDMTLPVTITNFINSGIGMAVVIFAAVTVFYHSHTIVGVLAFLVAYQLIRNSTSTSADLVYKAYQPTYTARSQEMQELQPIVRQSLEEETCKKYGAIS